MFLQEHSVTWGRFEQVAGLIEGFETPFGMELLATVHWVAKHQPRPEQTLSPGGLDGASASRCLRRDIFGSRTMRSCGVGGVRPDPIIKPAYRALSASG